MKDIYLDNAATTKIDKNVLDVMMPFLKGKFANPSSMHSKGIEAKNAMDYSRKKVSEILNCNPQEIIFTGSGTESDNLAILGFARANKDKGRHIITTKIEHHAVTDSFEKLKDEGFKVTFISVDEKGILNSDELKEAINDETILVSVIYANNEIGVIQNIGEISEICKKRGVAIHTDACQAANYLDIDVKRLGVDLMTLNGSKLYGPKGVGVLYKKKGIKIEPLLYGGGQEFGLRSSTENVANIVGFSKALEITCDHKKEESERLVYLRDFMIERLLKIKNTLLNGHATKRLPNNVNISFLGVEGESLLLLLNEDGIYASTGSACSSDSLEPSHVIIALGSPKEIGHSSIRFSLGRHTTKEDIEYVVERVKINVDKLRKISPLNYDLDDF